MAKIDKNGKEWKVVALTPAGRRDHLRILKKYIEKNNLIDTWQLWLNTGDIEDIKYINEIASDKIEIKRIEGLNKQDIFSICKFFKYAQDDDTIYVRLDDDIVFIEDNAIEELLNARLENENPFVVFANIVNNAVINNIHQEIGVLGKQFGEASIERFDPVNHSNHNFVKYVHNNFIDKYRSDKLNEYFFENRILKNYEPFSINCFAFFGKDMKELPGIDEEVWISHAKPNADERPNMICGKALVVHYAFFPQRKELNKNTNLLDIYKKLWTK